MILRLGQFIFILIFFVAAFARGEGKSSGGGGGSAAVIDDPVKKADNRYKDRWTLADWFETQRKTRLQDQWLSTRTSSNAYEFYLGGDTTTFKRTDRVSELTENYKLTHGTFGAFASIAGLEGQYFSTTEKTYGWNAQFMLRILGRSVQSTHITLHHGLKNRAEDILATQLKYQIQYSGVAMDIYITRLFGFGGLYRKYFENSENAGLKVGGERVEGQVFIDYSFLRLYGKYFKEPTQYIVNGVKTGFDNSGILIGGTLFF